MRPDRFGLDEVDMKPPRWYMVLWGLCAALNVAVVVVIIWAVVRLVSHFT